MNKEAQEKLAEAVNSVFQGIYVPAFVEKLASHGIQPKDEEALQEYLKLAHDLRQKGAENTVIEDEEISILKEARAALNPNLSLHENAASTEGLVQAFTENEEIRKLAKANLVTQFEVASAEAGDEK